jgi:hypothetical protein
MMSTHTRSVRLLFAAFGFLLFVLATPAALRAQTVTGTMQGTITDQSGAVIPGVTVTLRNVETGQERVVTTNDDGTYNAPFLPLGRYNVTASTSNFGRVTRENVEVTLNQTIISNFELRPAVNEDVTVTSDSAAINTTNAEIKGSLNAQEILDKPTANQGNFLTLAETFTGYQENPTSGQNNPTLSSGSSINFNGTGSRGATFQINGVNNDDSSENQNRQGASLSTIREFQVITNNFTAEFGRGYGAVVLVQTKNGTNDLHGDAYIYHNNSALNAANNVFNPGVKKGVTRRNQFGFTSGFPVLKNKLFGFVSLDHTENSGALNFSRDVFTAAERDPANWFRQLPTGATQHPNDTPANRAFIGSVIDRFAGALPNDPAAGPRVFRGQQGFSFPDRDYSGRFDWNARSEDNVFARWQYTRQRRDAEDLILGERADQNNKQQNFGLTWTHLFSERTVGEFRYGLGARTTLVNITAGNDTPVLRFANPLVIGGGTIIGNAGAFPIQRYQTDHQFVYNLSTLFGNKHHFKAGTDIRRQKLDDFADNFSRGFYNITGTCGGVTYRDPAVPAPNNTSGLIAFLNGCVTTYQKGFGPFFLENRINESNFYFEDNWKVTPNLTLNLGARYEYVSAPKEAAGRLNYGFGADSNNIEPRVGFAYSPNVSGGFFGKLFGASGDSSIRGGYGIYHGRIFQSVFSQSGATVRFNPPNAFFYNQTGVATALFNPNNLADPTNGFTFTPGPQTVRHSEALIDPGLEMPYTQQWNLSFERQLPINSALRISYTGNRGIGLLRFAIDNLPLHNGDGGVLVANHPNNAPAVLYTAASRTAGDPRGVDVRGQTLRPAANILCAGTGLPGLDPNTLCPVSVPLGAFEYSFRVPRINERRPLGAFSNNTVVSNAAWSYYHGLQVEWTKKLSRNTNFQASYTFSKSLDTTSEATVVGAGDTNQTGNDARAARGLSRFHTPHRFTFYGSYRTPWFSNERGILGQTLGGWQISTVVKLSSGTPFTVINGTGLDLNFDGFNEIRPILVDPSVLGNHVTHPLSAQSVLPRAAFRAATTADFNSSTVGRNTFFADGVKNVDVGITKNFPLPWESHKLTLRADLFNAFNHVQYGFPVADLTNANFGRITGTATQYAPRTVQISLRYGF